MKNHPRSGFTWGNETMRKSQLILLLVNVVLLVGFGAFYLVKLNFEFVIYVGVIIFFLFLVGLTRKSVDYTLATLIGLTVWSLLHLAGGSVKVGDARLYDFILIRLSDTYPVWRYDQLVHIWGFASSTLVAYSLLQTAHADMKKHPLVQGLILVLAGLGMGALNEILEFFVSIAVPESGVGGYVNTALDLCADGVGALLGLLYIRLRYVKRTFSDTRA